MKNLETLVPCLVCSTGSAGAPTLLNGVRTSRNFSGEFFRVLEKVVAKVPEEPVVLLSGGLDSTMLLKLLHDSGKGPIAITMTSESSVQDESQIARSFCQSLGVRLIDHPIKDVDPFRPGGRHLLNRDIGLGLFPGLEYEADTVVAASNYSSTVVSGVWADQLFAPSDAEFLDIALSTNNARLWDTVIAKRGLRFAASHFASKSGRWRALRSKPSWAAVESWLRSPPDGEVAHPFSGFQAQLVDRSIAALEREAGVKFVTPFRDPELVQLVESFDPVERVAKAPNKLALREIASQILPKEVAYRPKTAHFTEIFQDALKRMPKEEILRRLTPLEPYFNVSPDFLAEEAMSVREGRALVRLTYALILGDVLSYDA